MLNTTDCPALNVAAHLALFALASCLAATAQPSGVTQPQVPPVHVTQSATGFDASIGDETMRVTICSDSVVHVVTHPHGEATSLPQPWLLPAAQSCPGAHFDITQDTKRATLKTAAIAVTLDLTRGQLAFATLDGKNFLREGGSAPRTYTPETLNGEQTYRVVDRFSPDQAEAIYGLGQHQSGLFNYRGATVELAQNNTDIAIPLLLSTNGYGLLWNSASLTYMDNRFPLELKFDTLSGAGVDYFVLYGPEFDQVVHQYRTLTGHAPMLPRWSYGFIQSKDRYTSLDEILAIANRYRAEHIPADTIVQDWYWWKHEGDPIFNANYHDVPGDLQKLHDLHFHTMISTWGLMDPASDTFGKLQKANLLVKDAHVYDATSPEGRQIYWDNLPGKLFAQGWDSFWLDSAEPEEFYPHGGDAVLTSRNLAIGNGATYTNIYPFLHNLGIQENWRKTTDRKRVFLLTRSAFLGQQRVGGTVWSGDVYQSFWALSRQVPAGLNYALSGMPYWTTDIGGYHPTMDTTGPAYQELYARWFQFGVFCPVFRSHGHRPNNEMWSYPQVEPILLTFDKLRYRMMPYIYSLAWQVSASDYTLMRPLPMDFRADPLTWNDGTEFMFGPALLVNPVTEAGAAARRVYLPANTTWYDFWTGEKLEGGKHLMAAAPLDRIPLYVRAGSILPLGPEQEYADQNPNGPIELRIYPGANGAFTLYNDSGDTYDYERGAHSTIPITWSESARTLTLGSRQGSYPNMPRDLTFHIVIPNTAHGTGEPTSTAIDRTVTYSGVSTTIKLP
ncbi:MAG TPA: TIM-barrel domain-containing protein [Acidobacteriaceae bacterium]|nr:TIM-barrel domain-containing protein [Acidobacteriaceae bacterium]